MLEDAGSNPLPATRESVQQMLAYAHRLGYSTFLPLLGEHLVEAGVAQHFRPSPTNLQNSFLKKAALCDPAIDLPENVACLSLHVADPGKSWHSCCVTPCMLLWPAPANVTQRRFRGRPCSQAHLPRWLSHNPSSTHASHPPVPLRPPVLS